MKGIWILFLFAPLTLLAQQRNDSLTVSDIKKDSIIHMQEDSLVDQSSVQIDTLRSEVVDSLGQIDSMTDTILKDEEVNLKIDTIPEKQDSLLFERNVQDTLDTISIDEFENLADTIPINKDTSRILGPEDDQEPEKIERRYYVTMTNREKDSLVYQYNDSLLFTQLDSSYFILGDAQKMMMEGYKDSVIRDSILQSLEIIKNYLFTTRHEKALNYLSDKLKEGVFDTSYDTILLESINLKNSLSYILDHIEKDSILLLMKGRKSRDSIQIVLRKELLDTGRLKIKDNKDETAILWLRSKGKDRVEVFLDESVSIEETGFQESVKQTINVDYNQQDIKETKKINMTLPIWDIGGITNLMFNQGYVSNWVEGGENSLSTLAVLELHADYSYGDKRTWDSKLEYKYGLLKTGSSALRKNDDRLEINSKYGQKAFTNWYYSFLLNFKTQMFKGYDYPNDSIPVSSFLAPGYLVFSVGLDYKPSKKLTLLISPLTSKFTIVSDTANYDQTSYGLAEDERIREEIGAYIKATSRIKVMENITLENRVNLFTNYTNNPQNIDVDWEAILDIKANERITIKLNTHLIYDDDVDIPVFEEINGENVKTGVTKKIQFKEMLSIGFRYRF